MKLYYQTHSPYARKVLVMAHELGLAERLEVTVSSVQKYMTRAILACYQVVYEE